MTATTAGVCDVRRNGLLNLTGDTADHSTVTSAAGLSRACELSPLSQVAATPARLSQGRPRSEKHYKGMLRWPPIQPMTWNWKLSLTATGATALAGWLASPPPQSMTPPSRAAIAAPAGADPAAISEVEHQARRLSARLAAPAAGAPPSRNPFQFGARPQPRRAAAAAPAVTVSMPPPVDVPAPFPLRLSGIAVDIVNGAEKRTAVISGPAGLELAGEGESAAPGYRVVTVGESFAEVERVSDGARERLTLSK